MKTAVYKIGSLAVALYCLFSCSSVKVASSPQQIFFTENDTLLILGFTAGESHFASLAQQQMDNAFLKCGLSKVIGSFALRDSLVRKMARQNFDMGTREFLDLLKKLKLTGYVVDAAVLSYSDENSIITFSPNNEANNYLTRPVPFDPWITFRFRIHHVNTNALVFRADITVKSNTFIVGQNVDEDIGLTKGLNAKVPIHEFRKALRKLTKRCKRI